MYRVRVTLRLDEDQEKAREISLVVVLVVGGIM